MSEGWCNKQKGALQVLFQCGWIDLANVQNYIADGKKATVSTENSPDDPTRCKFFIKSLMKQQNEFITELTLLQYHRRKLGCIIDQSPKFHPNAIAEDPL